MSQSPNQNPVSIDLAELHARASALLAVGDLDDPAGLDSGRVFLRDLIFEGGGD